ncbi:MAG: MG2 domain-containing protein, partial [Spirochaetota bacterium]|nr:MG2 domain-containing protein [Spirochaetota bacterium]
MRNYSSKGLLISIISMFLFLFSVELSSGSSYLELATEKVFSSGEKVYVTAASNNTHKIGIRVYQLNSPKDYLTKQKNIHYPRVNSKRRASSLLQINEDLKVKMTNQWQTFLRGNFNSKLRGDLTKSLALKDLSDAKPVKRDYSLFPVLKGYPLLRSFEHQLEKGKYYYNYSQIPLDLKKRGVYLIEGVYKNRAAYTVVIISDIAFVTKTYRTGRLIYVTNRKTGQPVKSANIEIYKDKKLLASGKTSSEGIFRYPSGKKEGSRVLIFAQKGKDFTLSDPYFYRKFFRSRAVVYIYTSRPVYRPGQEISFKAILRDNVDEIYRLPKAGSRVQVKIKDARQTVVYKKTLALNDFGTLSDKLKLPVSQSLGNYAININYQNNDYFYHFKVE